MGLMDDVLSTKYVQDTLKSGMIFYAKESRTSENLQRFTFMGYAPCRLQNIAQNIEINNPRENVCTICNGKVIVKEKKDPICMNNSDGSFVYVMDTARYTDFIKVEEMII